MTALSHYRPQRSYEGYVFTGVCLSTGGGCLFRGGGVSAQGGMSAPRGRLILGVPGLGDSASGEDGVPGPRGVPAPRGCGIPACTEADTPPGETVTTAADGTHPTGMHSCLRNNYLFTSVHS